MFRRVLLWLKGDSTMEEIWKDIEGYEGRYQVSNLGRVKGLDRYVPFGINSSRMREVPGKLLKLQPHNKGYLTANLSQHSIITSYLVHRLVAEAFMLNPDNKEMVNHKDGNKRNNNATNLEWATRQENEDHAFRTGLKELHNDPEHMHKMREAASAVNGKQVRCIETGVIYRSKCQAGKLLGVDESSIGYSIDKKRTIRVGTFEYV